MQIPDCFEVEAYKIFDIKRPVTRAFWNVSTIRSGMSRALFFCGEKFYFEENVIL